MPKQRKRPITGSSSRPGPISDTNRGRQEVATIKSLGTSHQATQSTIATYHTLLKRRSQLLTIISRNSPSTSISKTIAAAQTELASVDERMAALGGLEGYQIASTLGQDRERGGDSSKVLVEWLKELGEGWRSDGYGKRRKLRMLEIGALSPTNAASLLPFISNHPIDLNARCAGIVKEDFLGRPEPVEGEEIENVELAGEIGGIEDEEEIDTAAEEGWEEGSRGKSKLSTRSPRGKFDIVSCSLVLNFVPDPGNRGKMLSSIHAHLRPSTSTHASYLFLVLPTPCLTNSRYLTPDHFVALMTYIGFERIKERMKQGGKVAYSLWKWVGPPREDEQKRLMVKHEFGKKRLINEGKKRNNFVVLLK